MIKIIINFLLFVLCSIVLFLISYFSLEKDYSNEYMFDNIIGKTYLTQERIFVTEFSGTKKITLQTFQRLFGNNERYEKYLKNPDQLLDSYLKVHDVIEKGAIMKVHKVVGYSHIEMGKIYRVEPIFPNYKFKYDQIDASWLFKRNLNKGQKNNYYLVDENILKELEG